MTGNELAEIDLDGFATRLARTVILLDEGNDPIGALALRTIIATLWPALCDGVAALTADRDRLAAENEALKTEPAVLQASAKHWHAANSANLALTAENEALRETIEGLKSYSDRLFDDREQTIQTVEALRAVIAAVTEWVERYAPNHGAYIRYDEMADLHRRLAGSTAPTTGAVTCGQCGGAASPCCLRGACPVTPSTVGGTE